MSKLNFNLLNFVISVHFMHHLCINGQYVDDSWLCGVPGLPAHGNITPYADQYETSERITYNCHVGFTREGQTGNTCNKGLWDSPKPPLCRENHAFRRPSQFTKVVQPYTSSLAVDGKPETCAISSSDANQRVWSVKFKTITKVEKVKITAESDMSNFSLSIGYKKDTGSIFVCGIIESVENYNTLEKYVTCEIESDNLVVIDRFRPLTDGFRLCEVEVYAKSDYRCGEPDRPLYCTIADLSNYKEQRVKYRARPGYKINHETTMVCVEGSWHGGPMPVCGRFGPSTPNPITTKTIIDDKEKAKNSTEVGSNFIVGVAIGVTAASISTIVVIVIVIIVMKKYYKRNENRCSGSMSEQGTIFLRANPPSSIGSCSPTIHPQYSRPWDDPDQHTYEYICTDSLPPAPDLDLPPIPKDTDLNIDRAGYLNPRSSSTKRQWTNSHERERALRQTLLNVPYRNEDNKSLPNNGRVNSFNELEVDAYGYPEVDDACRV